MLRLDLLRDLFPSLPYFFFTFKIKEKRMLAELKDIEKKIRKDIVSLCSHLPVIKLTQNDFRTGTYRIRKPGYYILKEDIIFSPNPDNDFMPRLDQKDYAEKPFSLGFFCAISVECRGVCIDLNGHTLQQSREHALQQRFFACIDLASTPFLPGQGPGDFGPTISPGLMCWIKNGTLGLSSHHGIHGNNASWILIEHLIIRDWEVAGIALNGSDHIVIRNVHIGPNRQDIPVMATYSSGRFLVQFTDRILSQYKSLLTPGQLQNLTLKRDRLVQQMNQVFTEVMQTGKTTDPLFQNKEGLIDGNIYGVLIHPPGVAINDFINNNFNGKFVEYVFLKNIRVSNVKGKVDEIVGLSLPDGKGVQFDTTQSVFQIEKVTDAHGHYKGNALSDLQIALGSVRLSLLPSVPQGVFGKLNFSSDLIEWAQNPSRQLSDILSKDKYQYKCSSDSMFHLNKGNFGFRLDGITRGLLHKLVVDNLVNEGNLGSDICGPYRTSHDLQERIGYRGADCTGYNFSRCSQIISSRLIAKTIVSRNGESRGIRFINSCSTLLFGRILVSDIIAGSDSFIGTEHLSSRPVSYTGKLPNMIPSAIGIKLEDPFDNIKIKAWYVDKLSAPGNKISYWER